MFPEVCHMILCKSDPSSVESVPLNLIRVVVICELHHSVNAPWLLSSKFSK